MAFKFGGVHLSSISSDIGCRNISDSLLPEQKEVVLDYDSMDGEIDMSEANVLGRVMYKTRTFEREIFIRGGSMQNTRQLARKLATYFSGGYKELVFDETPDVTWTAKVANQIDLENVLSASGRATIYFKAQPYGVGAKNVLSWETTSGLLGVTINNSGYYTKPIIRIKGDMKSCTVARDATVDGITAIGYGGACSDLVINCKQMTVSVDSKVTAVGVTGSFFEFEPGDNYLSINANCTAGAKITVSYDTLVL
jgi:predicted phage tail component-like protein